jgi:hypothetical protein
MGIFYSLDSSSQEPSSQEPSSQEPSSQESSSIFINQDGELKYDDTINDMISRLKKHRFISRNMNKQHNFSEEEIQFDPSMIIILGIPQEDRENNIYEILYLEPAKCFGVLLSNKIYECMKVSLPNFSASFCDGCEDVFFTSNFYQLVGENIPQNGNSVPFDTSSPDWLHEGHRDCTTNTDNFKHWWQRGKPIIEDSDPNDNKFVFHVDKNGMVTLTICHGGLIRNPTDSYDALIDQLENDNLDEPSNNNYINYADLGPLIYKGNNEEIITFTLGKIPNIKILSSCGIIIETYKTM